MKQYLFVTIMTVIPSLIAVSADARDINITCTFQSSIDKDGYTELSPTSFNVGITEDRDGFAISGFVTENRTCPYQNISIYNERTIKFDTCSRPSWLPANRVTPNGYLEIDRFSGQFSQYVEYPDIGSYIMLNGICAAATQKF